MNLTLRTLTRSVAAFGIGALALSTASAQTLLLHYSFDEASGDAIDSGIAPAANGSLEGAADRVIGGPAPVGGTGLSGFALDLTGGGGYVDAGNQAKFNGISQFTITGWLNLDSAGTHGNHRIFSKQTGGAFDGISLHIRGNGVAGESASGFAMQMFLGGETGFAYEATPGGNFDAADKWMYFAVTYDGTATSNNANYYWGTETTALTHSHTSTINAGAINDNAARAMIGRTDASPGSTVNPNGYLDDFRLYSGILSTDALEDTRLAIPEPSTYAVIFGGLALAFAAVRRYRKSRMA